MTQKRPYADMGHDQLVERIFEIAGPEYPISASLDGELQRPEARVELNELDEELNLRAHVLLPDASCY